MIPKKRGLSKDDPMIENYDPEAGLPKVDLSSLRGGRPFCPTCRGKGVVDTVFIKIDDQGNLVGSRSQQTPCPSCKS